MNKPIQNIFEISKGLESAPIALYGAGRLGRQFLEAAHIFGIQIDCFLDSDSRLWGQDIKYNNGQASVRVMSPKEVDKKKTNVIISVVETHSSIRSLREYGFKNIFTIPSQFYHTILKFDWKRFFFVLPRLGDERSREVLLKAIESRLTGQMSLESVYEPNQYFPGGIVRLSDEEIFVDGGSFNGSSAKELVALTGGKFSEIHIFEPLEEKESSIISGLEGYIRNGKAVLTKKALFDEQGHMSFHESGPASRITEYGERIVESESLDNYFEKLGIWPTFIKLDVEGAELKALKGAKKCIERKRPKLAVCLYHRLEDYYELPKYLMEHYPFYSFFVRHHSMSQGETILYAVWN